MCSYASMLQTIDTTKDSFSNRMMARNILQFRLYSSCKKKKNKPSIVKELECDFNYRSVLWLSNRNIWNFSSCYNFHSWVLCAELCFVSTTTLQGNTHWLSKSHLLKVWDILSHVINTALSHTCLMYWLSFKTDHDRLLAILAKYILSREIFLDIWLTINLRGKKICCAYLDCQPTWMKRIILPASNFK